MQIKINDQTHHLTDACPRDLAGILNLYIPELKAKGIAVALNNLVIPRQQWPDTTVENQAHILIIQATQGG
ncbi:sulfur carrier protein ThiS [Sphingobacterium sp. UT-1RO-CII-1]|uniref:sulfur carrier protein ThiS n=1 Tax=Sphingobacterium sp. UT-1RO-CII-1 TaxID=2995225 RepID=UPI00227B962D|nr:sulfur carrier protein ThiS [Sphingobacterium sp. UT-1RO-CII-1]MCY4781403.1 sulfur carrier protein ThiS [Sphingobacterium sp. UT-1RO-CII-1]